MAKLIGTDPNQVPTNADLGTMAYQDYDSVAPVLIGGRRNWLINGDFQVSQRGAFTTASTYSANTYYVDRWKGGVSGSFTSQRNLNQTLPNGKITTSYRVTSTGGAYAGIQQFIEDYSVFSGQLATFSFWAKTNKAGCSASFYTVANQFDVVSDIVADEQWHYYQATALVPTGGTAMRPEVWTGTGSSSGDYLELAQVQLELGKVATPFEHRSYGEELALCQRYYEVQCCDSNRYATVWSSPLNNFSNCWGIWQFQTEKRASPSFSFLNGGTWSKGGTTELVTPTRTGVNFNSDGYFYFYTSSGSVGDPIIAVDAEL